MDEDRIPTVGTHRGIGLHNHQTPARLAVVRAAIDQVADMGDVLALVAFAEDPQQPPEARFFAAHKVAVEYEMAAERRENRPTSTWTRSRLPPPALIPPSGDRPGDMAACLTGSTTSRSSVNCRSPTSEPPCLARRCSIESTGPWLNCRGPGRVRGDADGIRQWSCEASDDLAPDSLLDTGLGSPRLSAGHHSKWCRSQDSASMPAAGGW